MMMAFTFAAYLADHRAAKVQARRLKPVPVGVSHAGRLPDLGGDQREMPFREPRDIDPNVQRTRGPLLRDYAPGHDVEGLKAGEDAGECARISLGADAQAERLCRSLFRRL